MKKVLLIACSTLLGGMSASAYWLDNPVYTKETVGENKIEIEWSYPATEVETNTFQVVVFKMHKATADERFVLASTDFDYLDSKGTQKKHEERGAIWDYIPTMPGWWVRYPLYMNKAIGIDAFQYFPGNEDGDIFGGAYMLSPDYDLSNVTDKRYMIQASLGSEATSVSGGFAIWAWNTNWVDVNNIDYKPVYGMDSHFDTLSPDKMHDYAEDLSFPNAADYTDPDDIDEVNGICHDRTRVMFYGRGYSAYWINSVEVAVNLKAGDMIDYAAEAHNVEGTSFTIDTSDDTDNDYVYAYEVRAVLSEYDEYRQITTITATNYPYPQSKYIVGKGTIGSSGVENIAADTVAATIAAAGNTVTVSGLDEAENVTVFNISGASVFTAKGNCSVTLPAGIYLVKAGKTVKKVIL